MTEGVVDLGPQIDAPRVLRPSNTSVAILIHCFIPECKVGLRAKLDPQVFGRVGEPNPRSTRVLILDHSFDRGNSRRPKRDHEGLRHVEPEPREPPKLVEKSEHRVKIQESQDDQANVIRESPQRATHHLPSNSPDKHIDANNKE